MNAIASHQQKTYVSYIHTRMGLAKDAELSRPETPSFSRIFTHEGDIEYTGCGTEHRGIKARALP